MSLTFVISCDCLCGVKALLPIRYQSDFYSSLPATSQQGLTKIAFFNDIAVGCISSRIETRNDLSMLNILTLAVLPVYRGRSIGTKLVEFLIQQAKSKGLDGVGVFSEEFSYISHC